MALQGNGHNDFRQTEDQRRRAEARARLAARQRAADADLNRYRASNYSSRNLRRGRTRFAGVVVGVVLAAIVLVGVGVAVSGVLSASPGAGAGGAATPSDVFDGNLAASDVPASSDAEGTSEVSESVVMTLAGSQDTYVLAGESYLEAGCHAADPQSGSMSLDVSISGEVDTSVPGTYTVTYTATAPDGKVATKQRSVHVVEAFEEAATSLPVLMYHYVYAEDDQPEELNGNYLLNTKLEAHLRYLVDNGYYYPSYQEVKAFAEGTHTLPAKSVVLTFDDCEAGFLKYGVPLLTSYQVPATSFVICSDADAQEKVLGHLSEYVQYQSHSFAMHQAGSNIGRGGRIHAMTQEEIVDDLRQAQAILGTTEAFAYPFGDTNELAQAALREAGVLCGFTIINDRVYPGDDPTVLNRVRISGEYSQESFEYLVAPNAA